jgi:hypothetical protein
MHPDHCPRIEAFDGLQAADESGERRRISFLFSVKNWQGTHYSLSQALAWERLCNPDTVHLTTL